MNLKKTLIYLSLHLAVFTLFRLLILVFYYREFSDLSAGLIIFSFINGTRFDLSILLTFSGIFYLLLNLPFKFTLTRAWQHVCGWGLFAAAAVSIALLSGDFVYYDFVGRHTTNELILALNDFRYLVKLAFSEYLFLSIGGILLTATAARLWLAVIRMPSQITPYRIPVFILFLFLLFLGIRGTVSGKSISVIDAYSAGNTAAGNLTLNGIFTTYHYSRKADYSVKHRFMPDKEAFTITGYDYNKKYPLYRRFQARAEKRNIIIFLLESWAAYFVDSFGENGFGATPEFDRIAAKSLRFQNFYASGARSINGIQAVLTGIPPLPGIPDLGHGIETASISRIGHLFNRAGYETLFIQSSKRRSFRIDAVTAALGFKYYYGAEDIPVIMNYPEGQKPPFGYDYDTMMFLNRKLNQLKEPFTAVLFSGSTHIPYPSLPEKFYKRPHDSSDLNGFLNTLNYSDYSLGEFFRAARRQKWFKNTVFLITADHSEGARYREDSIKEDFHIPLIIYDPRSEKGRDIQITATQLDLLPTILELSGAGGYIATPGRSLIGKNEGMALVSRGQTLGAIQGQGWLTHSLERRLEYGPRRLGEEFFNRLEKRMLAEDQIVLYLLRNNRWNP